MGTSVGRADKRIITGYCQSELLGIYKNITMQMQLTII